MDTSSGFGKRPATVFSDLEMEASRGLLELPILRERPLLQNLPLAWRGVKRPRTFRLSVSNYDEKEGEPKNAEETEATANVTGEEPPVIMKKIRILGRHPSEIVAKEPKPPSEIEAKERKPLLESTPPLRQGITTLALTGSPTSPLLLGCTSVSSHGEPSDSNNSLGLSRTPPPSSPRDRPLAPSFQLKVGKKAKVHGSSNSRDLKKKTIEELKQRYNELSTIKEELLKEWKKLVGCHESLNDQNKSLKEQLVLKFEGTEQDKVFLHSSDAAQQTMVCHSRLNQSSSHRPVIPDLNLPFEESSDNNSGDFDNQLLERDKFVLAAQARKYRVEYIRSKQSQFRNVQSKGHQ